LDMFWLIMISSYNQKSNKEKNEYPQSDHI